MPLITWDDKFSVGVQSMDAQHQRWFALMNNLHDAMREGRGKAVQDAILAEMIDYTQTHFRREEELLQAKLYPNLLEHQDKHRLFTNRLFDMQSRIQKGEPVLTFDLMDSLKDWLQEHIMKEDMKYGTFLSGGSR